jgi:hypothetical protein
MSLKRSVTPGQLSQIEKLWEEKGGNTELFQTQLLDNGTMSNVLDAALKPRVPIDIDIVAPTGGRIVTVSVKVQLDREWQEAINAAGPNTPDNYNVRKVGDLYPPTGTGVVDNEELILLNYIDGGGSWGKALAWADAVRLRRTDPRRVFAIGEGHPKFHHDVGINPTYVVATEECTFGGNRRTCHVWWNDSERGAYLNDVRSYGGSSDWFAFRK